MGRILNATQISKIMIEFERELRAANKNGDAFEYLEKHNISYEQYDETPYDKKRAKLLIIGESDISKSDIVKMLKRNGIDINRVEMALDYDDAKTYKWNSIQYSYKYSDIIVGPMGHMSKGNDGYSSIVARMEKEDGWPNIIRSEANLRLKFSKTSLYDSLMKTEFYQKQLSQYTLR